MPSPSRNYGHGSPKKSALKKTSMIQEENKEEEDFASPDILIPIKNSNFD